MKTYQKKPWTTNERAMLRTHYYFLSAKELEEKFPGRSINSITKQVAYLRKRGWSFKKPV